MNKKKIINDPIYGFINIRKDIIFDLIEHPAFQRLRRIQQVGLSSYVYPGAMHSRFHHALGAMHLMSQAIDVLRNKGNEITAEEAEAVTIAILLHDIGHGPFSHALEHSIVQEISHERISVLFMQELNELFNGKLSLCLRIFLDNYHKPFLHQLVSSQLDMDRLDYLIRDSFYSGVSEGVIGYDRIIKMLDVRNENLVVEAKGIYSIEKFLIARRIMYWQVYLHKTVLCSEMLLVKTLQRAKVLAEKGQPLFATPALAYFLNQTITLKDFEEGDKIALKNFANLDDMDVFTSIKVWQNHDDRILSNLCTRLVNRKLPKMEIRNEPIDQTKYQNYLKLACEKWQLSEVEASYLVFFGSITNNAYDMEESSINILFKDGSIRDIVSASDNLTLAALTAPVTKYYLCYPKELME